MTAATDRQHVRFLGAVITVGFTTVAFTLAIVFADGVVPLLSAFLPLAAYVLAAHEELGDLEEDSAPVAATDGGREMDRSTETGGDRNRRTNNNR